MSTPKILGKRKRKALQEEDYLESPESIKQALAFTFKQGRPEHTLWYQLEVWDSPKAFNSESKLTFPQLLGYLMKEYSWIMDCKFEQVQVMLQHFQFDLTKSKALEEKYTDVMYRSSLNHPLMVSWPRALPILSREDFMAMTYPDAQRSKKFGVVYFKEIIENARKMAPGVDLIKIRVQILQYVKKFSNVNVCPFQNREIWKQEQRLQDIGQFIFKAAVDPKVDPVFSEFECLDHFRVCLMNVIKKDIKFTVVDKASNSCGCLFEHNKAMLKEAVFKSVEDMRIICRSRNSNEFFALASDLFQWQVVYYSREAEVRKQKDYFQVSPVYKLFSKENGYGYGDKDLKFIIALIRSIVMYVAGKVRQLETVVEATCIDNLSEDF